MFCCYVFPFFKEANISDATPSANTSISNEGFVLSLPGNLAIETDVNLYINLLSREDEPKTPKRVLEIDSAESPKRLCLH